MAMLSTLNRLRQRKIVEWALAYLAGAWLLMQLVEVLSGRWPLPLALQRGVDLHAVSLGMFDDVVQSLLGDAKYRQCRIIGQAEIVPLG